MKNIRYWLSILTGINFMKDKEEPQKAPEHVREAGGKWVIRIHFPGMVTRKYWYFPSFSAAQEALPRLKEKNGKLTLKEAEAIAALYGEVPPRKAVVEAMNISQCLARRKQGYRVCVSMMGLDAVYDGFPTREEAEAAMESCVNNMQEITLQEVADCLGEEVQVQIYQKDGDKTDGQQGNRRNEPVYWQTGKVSKVNPKSGRVVSESSGK